MVAVGQDRSPEPLRVSLDLEDFGAAKRVVREVRPALVVEIMKEPDECERVLVAARPSRMSPHRRLDGERVLQETRALGVLVEQRKRFASGR